MTLILAVDVGLYYVLQSAEMNAASSFAIMLIVSLAALCALGCLLHLIVLEHQKQSFRPDAGEVVMLQKPDGYRVSRISEEAQQHARNTNGSYNGVQSSPLDATGIFLTRPPKEEAIEDATAQSIIPVSPDTKDSTRSTVINHLAAPTEAVTALEESQTISDEIAESVSIPDLMQEIHGQGFTIKGLLKRYRIRIGELEASVGGNPDFKDSELYGTLIDARRIIGALEARLSRLHDVLLSHEPKELLKGREMIRQPLVIPRDAVNALISTSDLPTLPPNKWEETLDRLLSQAEIEASSNRVSNL
jgi:hypothetical protein